MNHRDYKKFNNGSIAHIYNRGNNKGKIFFDEQDYKAFLFRLALALGFYQKELKGENLLSMSLLNHIRTYFQNPLRAYSPLADAP